MADREREMLAAGLCPFCRPERQCLLCQGDFDQIAERLRGHYRPRAETCSDGRGGLRPSWYQGNRDRGGCGRREGPAQAEKSLDSSSRVSPRGQS